MTALGDVDLRWDMIPTAETAAAAAEWAAALRSQPVSRHGGIWHILCRLAAQAGVCAPVSLEAAARDDFQLPSAVTNWVGIYGWRASQTLWRLGAVARVTGDTDRGQDVAALIEHDLCPPLAS